MHPSRTSPKLRFLNNIVLERYLLEAGSCILYMLSIFFRRVNQILFVPLSFNYKLKSGGSFARLPSLPSYWAKLGSVLRASPWCWPQSKDNIYSLYNHCTVHLGWNMKNKSTSEQPALCCGPIKVIWQKAEPTVH